MDMFFAPGRRWKRREGERGEKGEGGREPFQTGQERQGAGRGFLEQGLEPPLLCLEFLSARSLSLEHGRKRGTAENRSLARGAWHVAGLSAARPQARADGVLHAEWQELSPDTV